MAFGTRAAIAGLTIALAIGVAAPAAAGPTASVSAEIAPEGYARIAFAFDRLPKPEVRLANSVLVVGFGEPVTLETAALSRGLGALAGVVRRDPDGTAIRIALQKPVRLVTQEAGETLFVDLLPTDWAGLPPPLPADVIAALTRDARAGRALLAEDARRAARPLARLTLEGASHPTFDRLVFGLGGGVDVSHRREGDTVTVSIAAPYRFDAAAARALLPVRFAGLTAEKFGKGLAVTVPAAGAGEVRGFRDGDDFILDIDRAAPAPEADQAKADRADITHTVTPGPRRAAPVAPAAEPAAAEARLSATSPQEPHPPVAAHAAATRPAEASSTAAGAGVASVRRVGETLRFVFPFARPTPAAIFLRGRTLWAVFDDPAEIDLSAFGRDAGGLALSVDQTPLERGRAVRIRLADERLVSAALEGTDWVVSLGENLLPPSGGVELSPSFDRDGRAAMQAEAAGLGAVRAIVDPEIGDRLTVTTLAGPARGFRRARSFVEFQTLASAQGLVFALSADDARVTGRLDQVFVERDGGLSLSASGPVAAAPAAPRTTDDGAALGAAAWEEAGAKPFAARERELLGAAALAAPDERPRARLDLARFYLATAKPADAAAVLGAIVEDGGLPERDDRLSILRAAADVALGRSQSALSALSAPSMRLNPEAALWRAAAEAADGRAGEARVSLRRGEPALDGLAPELQSRFVGLAVTLALDAGDAATAAAAFDRLDVLPATGGVAARDLIRARLAEALGRADRALAAYAALARRGDSAPSAEAELRFIDLALKTDALDAAAATGRLERLVAGWRGDWIEAAALSRLIELYGDAGRWRDAFSTLRVAVQSFPDAEGTRALQDRMQERFTELFLGAGADALPKLDALALFYDFKELSPGGKRGDELVRRLADKLVDVDLFDQAADLLDYQIDNRLTGAARAQVAARAALIDMMNGKPAKALEVLRKTRQADLPGSLMRARLRLEARAVAEIGRTELALEIADGLEGAEAMKLKADILWTARRWPEAGEALEATLGSAWRGPAPLDAIQRADVMRAAISLSLAEDGLGVDRVRQKFAAKMAHSPQAAAFEVVTAPVEARGDAFREIARSVAATSSFDAFLKEYRAQAGSGSADAPPPGPTAREDDPKDGRGA